MSLRIAAPALLLSLWLAAVAGGQATEKGQPKVDPAARAAAAGALETVAGMPVLTLRGPIVERGFAEGWLLADQILDCIDDFALSPQVVPQPELWDAYVKPMVVKAFTFAEPDRAWAAAVVEGVIARRGDAKIEKLGRALVPDDLLTCASIPDLRGFLCSSVALWGEATAGDAFLVGRNLDYFGTPKMLDATIVRVHAPLEGRKGWVGIGWPGLLGCLTGWNDAGVFIAIHDVYVKPVRTDVAFTLRPMALRDLIETLDADPEAVKAAVADLATKNFSLGANVLIGWCAGEVEGAAIVELDGAKAEGPAATLRESGGAPFVACSNHHRLRSERGHGCSRYAALCSGGEISMKRPRDLAGAWDLISEASMSMTIYRCVADLRSGRFEIDVRAKPQGDAFRERVRLDVGELLRAAGGGARADAGAAEKAAPIRPSSERRPREEKKGEPRESESGSATR